MLSKSKIAIWVLLAGLILFPRVSLAQISPWKIAGLAVQIGTGGAALASFLNQSAARNTPTPFTNQVLLNAKDLQNQGLPTSPYLLKAGEGMVKGVPPRRIQTALKKTYRQTRVAGGLTDQAVQAGWVEDSPTVRQQLFQDYRWALASGIPPYQLQKFNSRFPATSKKSQNLQQLNQYLWTMTEKPGWNPFPASKGPIPQGWQKIPPGQLKKWQGYKGPKYKKPKHPHSLYYQDPYGPAGNSSQGKKNKHKKGPKGRKH